MTTHRLSQLIALVAIVHFTAFSLHAQATFAPKIGAEWHYAFQTDAYDWSIPFRVPRKGILTVNYAKDTLIRGVTMKKFEQKEAFRNKGNDTLYNRIGAPFFMMQRNDSVFLMVQDTLAVAFVYKNQLGSRTKLKANNGRVLLDLDLQSVRDTTAFSNPRFSFGKYSYKTTTTILDVYFETLLVFLDRIGPINADLTVINSQGKASNYADTYTLLCYQDSEVGELKFSNRDCNTSVSVSDVGHVAKEWAITHQNNVLYISLQDVGNEYIKNVEIYDISGRLVRHINNVDRKNVLTLSDDDLPRGVLLFSVESNTTIYEAKKIVTHD